MKVLAFGSCMSNLTIGWLVNDYSFEQTHSVHHNRSDSFIRYFIDRSANMIPRAFLDDLFIYNEEGEEEARLFLLNQYEDFVGFNQLEHRRSSRETSFFDDLLTTQVDVILMDNFMDVAAKLMYYKERDDLADSPLFLNLHFFKNDADLRPMFDWWGDFLLPEESARNFAKIYRWLRSLQPNAKFFFLPYHSCSSLTAPDRFKRIHDFYPALLRELKNEDIYVIPPLELPPEYTNGEEDWPHFNKDLYRALAGHIYLTVVGSVPPFDHGPQADLRAGIVGSNQSEVVSRIVADTAAPPFAPRSDNEGDIRMDQRVGAGTHDTLSSSVNESAEHSRTSIESRIESALNPEHALFDELLLLKARQNVHRQIEIFETFQWRIPIKSPNPYRLMYDAYLQLDRLDSALSMASFVLQLTDEPSAVTHTYWQLFNLFVRRGNYEDAFTVFMLHFKRFTDEKPLAAAWQIADCARMITRDVPDILQDGSWSSVPAEAEVLAVQPTTPVVSLGPMLYGAKELPQFLTPDGPSVRPKIDVIRISRGRFVIKDGSVAVVDSNGDVQSALSVGDYPKLITARLDEKLAKGEIVESLDAQTSLLMTDIFAHGGNLCHGLLDHVTRLHLYEQAGVNLQEAVVVGAPLRTGFEREIFDHLGITSYVDVARTSQVRAANLYVSTNCHFLNHSADIGAAWAIEYLRKAFRPASPADPVKIYISRRNAQGRRISNEADVEAVLHKAGFITLAPEELPFLQQAALFSGATHIVAPHGAGLTNAIFAVDGAHVLEVFHPLYGTRSFSCLAHGAGWRYSVMIGRDWQTNEPRFNDAEAAGSSSEQFGFRDMKIDLSELSRWMLDSGAA